MKIRIENLAINHKEGVAEIKYSEETETGSRMTKRKPINIGPNLVPVLRRLEHILNRTL